MIKINENIKIDPSDVFETFVRASGPGGQHVNKVSTKVELRFNAKKSTILSDVVKGRLREIAGRKWGQDGFITIHVEKYRSQRLNRNLAKEKLIKLILGALEKPSYRLATRPSKAVKDRRTDQKIRRSKVKALRARVEEK